MRSQKIIAEEDVGVEVQEEEVVIEEECEQLMEIFFISKLFLFFNSISLTFLNRNLFKKNFGKMRNFFLEF